MYLQSVFDKVYTVQGKIVSDFRKIWGIQDEYEKKSRINHVHHCIDAVTIACITRDNYDLLAHYYYQIESAENKRGEYKPSGFPKPWPTFTQDIKELDKKVLISHYTPDNLLVQSKKKIRKKGVIQHNHKNQPIYQKGDTVRGSLHKETYYGAIEGPEGGKERQIRYVLRKDLTTLQPGDIKNIVDPVVRSKIESAIKGKVFKEALSSTIWMNEEKKVPIKKVRCYVFVKQPINLKEHRDLSNKWYKQCVHVINDENYIMIALDKKYIILNNLDAALIRKELGDFKYLLLKDKLIFEKILKSKLPNEIKNKFIITKKYPNIKYLLNKGLSVFLIKDKDELENFFDESIEFLNSRYYTVEGIDDDGIKLFHNSDARAKTDVLKYMNDIIDQYNLENNLRDKNGNIKISKLTSPKGGDVIDKYKEFPYIKIKPNNFNALIEGVHFRISPIGQIIKC